MSLVAEALHEAHISRIAADIVARGEAVRVVLVAGPSSSGKTTFSKRLAVQLLASGRRPYPVALDDYFLDRDRTPLDEHGERDFESLAALDVPLINAAPARADARRDGGAAAVLVPHRHAAARDRRHAGRRATS